VSFGTITLCVASQQVIPMVSVYFVMTQSGKFWSHSHTTKFVREDTHTQAPWYHKPNYP